MAQEFIAYKKFTDIDTAEDTCKVLREHGIECSLQDSMHQYVKVVGYTQIEPGITLNLQSEDFSKADEILAAYYSTEIDEVDKNYYLFEFSDDELKNILAHPYEWGSFDFQLARKILKEKGIEYSEDYLDQKKAEKVAELSQLKAIPLYKLVGGYILSVIFPPAGLLIGLLILNNRNILPGGEKFYVHSAADRKHGQLMVTLGTVFTAIAILKLL